MAASSIEAVLFDLDGTLVDSAPELGAAADKMRVDRGLPSLPLAQYRPMAGTGARGMLGIAFGITPDTPDFGVLREEFFRNYEARMLLNTHVFDGVAELIGVLQTRRLAWGIVTNKSKRFTEPLVRSIEVFSSAGAVISGDTTPFSKPHPEPLFEAARRLELDPARCVYVGDDERDIIAGRAAGMRTVAATYGYMGVQADAARWEADGAIDSPTALLQWLKAA
ncbi:MAG TPA: phosphoglycolate phosphatase [Variovorax sp.]